MIKPLLLFIMVLLFSSCSAQTRLVIDGKNLKVTTPQSVIQIEADELHLEFETGVDSLNITEVLK